MSFDKRYKTVKILLEAGEIKKFEHIFDHIPRSLVATDMGMNYNRLAGMINNPLKFTLSVLVLFSSFMEIDPEVIINLAYQQGKENIAEELKPRIKRAYRKRKNINK